MDQRLRAIERRWRAGDPYALEALHQAYSRAGREPPDDVLRALPRWQRLLGFARRWRKRPLGARDGLSVGQIVEREAQLGVRLPGVLREWYRLVGGSLRNAQDRPVKLSDLTLERGQLVVYEENQGSHTWFVREGDLGLDDPPVHDLVRPRRPAAERLSEFLLYRTLHDVTGAAPASTIGRLRPGVHAGFFDDRADRRALVARYPLLPIAEIDGPWIMLHGDGDTILAIDDCEYITAAARTDEAWSALLAFPGLKLV